MAVIKRKSTVIILLVVCLIVFLSSGGLSTIYVTHTIKKDAEIINKLGIIRGSVQRLVKLEIAGVENDALIEGIDNRVDEFQSNEIKVYDREKEIAVCLRDLYPAWMELKGSVSEFRLEPSEENRQELLKISEKVWDLSNIVVRASQETSERKIVNYRYSYVFFLINLVLGLIIIYLIKKYVHDKLEFLVNYDSLTNIFNRRHFTNSLDIEKAKAERYSRVFSVIMFDIDRFKRVNDDFGHDAGDSVLKELAQIIQSHIRKSDSLFRIGGEEFVVIAAETNVDEAWILSEKIRRLIEDHEFRHVKDITVSLGVTQYYPGDTVDLIFKRADTGLYRAKTSGRNKSEIELNLNPI